jgi:hypothetical protein
LHPDTVGTPEYARSKLAASTDNNQVIIRRELRNSPPPGVYGKPADIMHKRVDRTSEARFVSPALHVAFAQIIDPSPDPGKPECYRYNITHCFTPETNTSIHYWWFNSRDYKPADEAIDRFLYEASSQAYYEDVEALEWIMDVVRNDGDPQIDLSFAPDKPGLMARRIMYRLAMKEIQSSQAINHLKPSPRFPKVALFTGRKNQKQQKYCRDAAQCTGWTVYFPDSG